MEPRSLKYIADSCAGEILDGSPGALVRGICTDSRLAQSGDLFVALRGDRFDGHDYLGAAARNGASAVLRERAKTPADSISCGVIGVNDTRSALGRLAARYRSDFHLPIIAVGGSNGKTTTKELIAAVLRQKYSTLRSEASFNNDIGVPLTLLKLQSSHQAAVLEVGTNHPGELAPLVRLIQPQYGVITSLGREHLEFFGDMAGVVAEEGSLAELVPAGGKVFVNGDNEWAGQIAKRARAIVVRAGLAEANDWRAVNLKLDERGATFLVDPPAREFAGEYRINLLGRHQVVNALFALAVGSEMGLGREELQRGLADCHPLKMRLQTWETSGLRVLDDSYNANADSMLAALQTLVDLPCAGRRVAVLGDMAELGHHSRLAHEEVGRSAARLGVHQLFAVGQMAGVLAAATRGAGLKNAEDFADVDAAVSAVKAFVRPGDLVLIKASRAARLERVAEALRGQRKESAPPLQIK